MTINIQLVEIPESERLSSRQMALPVSGGTIGRAYDCNVQLPDFSKSLSRVHAEVSRDRHGRYQVVNKSTNGMSVNGTALNRGQYHSVGDGDVWKMGGYTLLITDLSALASADLTPHEEDISFSEPLFSVDELDIDDAQFVESQKIQLREEELELPLQANALETDKHGREGFSAQAALGTVELGADPFADDEMMQPPSSGITVEPAGDGVQQSLQQLTALLAQQRGNQPNYDILMQCIQSSMDKFIEELSPEYLEDMFNSYISGWGSRDKKYWQLYKKQFQRKMARREFHRQFSSIFMEELRGKQP
ncbi:MAG: FHA domain-containing protein [Pseudomonadales bacterium]